MRSYYSDTIAYFRRSSTDEIIGKLTRNSDFPVEQPQRRAWETQIGTLRDILLGYEGSIHFEFSIPRMGRRADVVLIIGGAIFVLEFKTGESDFTMYGLDQVCDYALDLKNFHEPSADCVIAPLLVASEGTSREPRVAFTPQNDKLLYPINAKVEQLPQIIDSVLRTVDANAIDADTWSKGRYCPTPTIIEAATALYNNHSVDDISRSDASATNLSLTSKSLARIIESSKANSRKSICFVTGVPGAGKTLVGLNIATKHINKDEELYSVFLSGNGPLVDILREALARDKVQRGALIGEKRRIGEARREVKLFIQNVHHFRDDLLNNPDVAPVEHVALFDEAQRAWNKQATSNFMKRKKGVPDFDQSEPQFLISCLDRHEDWAVIVCLVGGGQEINTGEAGISEWLEALDTQYPHWDIYLSSRMTDSEYGAQDTLVKYKSEARVKFVDDLHLGVSMRSFRAENVSLLVKQILDLDSTAAKETLLQLQDKYPIALTRDLNKAKQWLKQQARGSERYGILVSSQAERLKPHAIDVRSPMDPIDWFLAGKDHVHSSYYLEDVATEFHVQGLELDWACITWDADFRYTPDGWTHNSFRGTAWQKINKPERQKYLKNAYRVLLTRARQGMVLCVPQGSNEDATRGKGLYDPTYDYLQQLGFTVLG
jgi:hypothetical protein